MSFLFGESTKESPNEVKKQPVKIVPGNYTPLNKKKLTDEEVQRIKSIREQIESLQRGTLQKIKELSTGKMAESPETMKKVEALKLETELKILKLRREIAQIKGNEKLVKEFDNAIDNIEHPEKYQKPPVNVEREIPEQSPPVEEKVR